ncbi:MAG: hypothetical protein MUO51_09860 [Woeseiaceae bacterium]|nr:hypothetical protein [Woeseiaceae bacterium]
MHGVDIAEEISGAMMPPFGKVLSDPEIGAIAACLRRTMNDQPATTVVGPAIGNAICAAVSARLRHIPIRPADVLAALKPPNVR